MRLLRPLSRVPLSGSPSSSTRRIPHWLRRSGIGLLALFLAGPASFAIAPAAPEIAIEQPAGTVLEKTVAASGDNSYGQTTVPGGLTDVQAVAAGVRHSVLLKGDGTVVAWGFNTSGQTDVPAGLTGVRAVAAGFDHTVALKTDGTVTAWGSNVQSQTSIPGGLTDVQAISAGYYHNVALKAGGTVVAWGFNASGQATVPVGLTGVRAVAAGGYHSVALKADGSVVVWGDNTFNQLTVPLAAQSGVRAIAAGDYHTVALKDDGTIVAWGRNDVGQTNVTAGLGGVRAIAAGGLETVALTNDGTVFAWGVSSVPVGATGVHSIAAGGSHIVALVNPVVAFGDQIAGTNTSKTFTIKNSGAGALSVTSASVTGGAASDFTVNTTGMLASVPATTGTTTFTVTFTPSAPGLRQTTLRVVNNDADEASYDIPLSGTGFTAPEITIEQPAGTALGKTLLALGVNNQGQTNVPAGLTDVQAIAAGVDHTVAIKGDGTVAAWGLNTSGQTNVPVDLHGVRAVAAGAAHSLALLENGTVIAWGDNSEGQATVPAGLTDVQAISAGYYHSAALRGDGTVVAWGYNESGRATVPVGLTGVQAIAAGGAHNAALKTDGSVVAWGRDTEGQATVPLAAQSGVRAIAAGSNHTLALKNDGTVIAWGLNDQHQTTVPARVTGVQAISTRGYRNLALKNDGTITFWGLALPGFRPDLTGVQAIASGGSHDVVLVNPAAAFGDQATRSTSAAKTFTIRNTGSADLTISRFALGGADAPHFTLNAPAIPATVAPGASTTVSVTFNPSSIGAKSVLLSILSNDADEGTYDIALTGTGLIAPATDDTGFTTGTKGITLDVLANDTNVNRATAAITFPTLPQFGSVSVVGGKVRYIPDGPLPLAGDTFIYHFDDGHGGIATATVTITNFAAIAGDYDGLIVAGKSDSGSERHRQSGYLRVTLSKTGALTGKLTFGGNRQALTGRFALMGQLDSTGGMASIVQALRQEPISLGLQFDAAGSAFIGTAESTGTDGQPFTSSITLAKRTSAAEMAGNYTMLVNSDATPGAPQGTGSASVTIRSGGGARIAGQLADGTPFASAAYLHPDETFPVYAVLFGGKITSRGSLRGMVQLPLPNSRASADPVPLEWFKPARPLDKSFPEGFTLNPSASFGK